MIKGEYDIVDNMNNDTNDQNNSDVSKDTLGAVTDELAVTDVSEEVLDILPSKEVHGDVEEIVD